ncbi:MAG: hypothetical protein H6Q42_3887 [Deltaproteobacteria bacterium]|jgi:tripartite-type tricarboxylate transporter receptor subunit TctC|nr:hypothetical protein [Deltaproteobacteria bacterium]
MDRLRKRIFMLAVFMFAALFALGAMAADFPAKPVTVIVPWVAGGSTDIVFRVLAETTTKHLGKPVIIENKAGGSGSVGPATMAASARPDGYTLSQIPMSVLRLPHLMKATWDPLKDFTYILNVSGYTYGTVVRKDAPWKTLKELVDYSKANPGKVNYATPGVGVLQHVTMEKIARRDGIKWIHVPCKGGIEVITAVMGGHVMVGAETTGWAPQVESGDLRLLCIWAAERNKKWPDAPTLKELGYNIVASSPFGIAGPKGMDPKVVQILHDAFKKGMDEPAFQQTLEKYFMVPMYRNTKDYVALINELFLEEKENAAIVGAAKKD